MSEELRMNAYWYSFEKTGCREIDEILSAVAVAGKMYHNTEGWTDVWEHDGLSQIDKIQNAANKAAEKMTRLKRKRRNPNHDG